jgi:hypothetical protein
MGMVGASNSIDNTSYFLVECEDFEMNFKKRHTSDILKINPLFIRDSDGQTIEWE